MRVSATQLVPFLCWFMHLLKSANGQCAVSCGQYGSCSGTQCACTGGWSGASCSIPPAPSPTVSWVCGGNGYILTSLASTDFTYSDSTFAYWVNACGPVSSGPCAGRGVSFCQQTLSTGSVQVVAYYQPSIDPIQWQGGQSDLVSYSRNGDSFWCNGARGGYVNFLCSTDTPYLNVTQINTGDSTCSYSATIYTSIVCGGPSYAANNVTQGMSIGSIHCGGGLFNISALDNSDLTTVAQSFTYAWRACSAVTSAGCSTSMQYGLPPIFCQFSSSTVTGLAYVGPQYTLTSNGMLMQFMYGGGPCVWGASVSVWLVCAELADVPTMSVTPISSCNYAAYVYTPLVCASKRLPAYSYSWVLVTNGTCSVSCGGGTRTETYDCMDQYGMAYPTYYDLCAGTDPSRTFECNSQPCYVEPAPAGTKFLSFSSTDCSSTGTDWEMWSLKSFYGECFNGYEVWCGASSSVAIQTYTDTTCTTLSAQGSGESNGQTCIVLDSVDSAVPSSSARVCCPNSTCSESNSRAASTSSMSTGQIAGVIVGVLMGAVLLVLCGTVLWWRCRRMQQSKTFAPRTPYDPPQLWMQNNVRNGQVAAAVELQPPPLPPRPLVVELQSPPLPPRPLIVKN